MLKRLLGLLLCCMLVSGVALAQDDGYAALSSLDGFYGVWTACASNDFIPYLVLHEDQTYEAYHYWQIDGETVTGDALLRHGTFTFRPADGALSLEGYDTAFTAKTGKPLESMESDYGSLEATPDTALLLLSAPVVEAGYAPSMLFMPMKDGFPLLPTVEALCANCEWGVSDRVASVSDDARRYSFHADGTADLTGGGEAETAATYALENGRMTLTLADGTTRRFLLQYHYIPSDEEKRPTDAETLAFYDFANEDDYGEYTICSRAVLLVRDMDGGAAFYLVRQDG